MTDTFSDDYIATLGAKVMTKRFAVADATALKGTREVTATIWDVMGQRGFREMLQDAFFYNAKAVLYVCDVTRPETLQSLSHWATSVSLVAGAVPSVVLANKTDLSEEARLTEADVHGFAASYGWTWLPTSAKSGENVEAAFRAIAETYLRSLATASPTLR